MANTANAAIPLSQSIVDFCSGYASLSFGFARWFLFAALVALIAETLLALWSKFAAARATPQADPSRTATDLTAAAKLLEALKGLLESLTKLPAWVAIFLAGLALLWMAAQRPEICQAPQGRQELQPGAGQSGGPTPGPQPGGAGAGAASIPPRGG